MGYQVGQPVVTAPLLLGSYFSDPATLTSPISLLTPASRLSPICARLLSITLTAARPSIPQEALVEALAEAESDARRVNELCMVCTGFKGACLRHRTLTLYFEAAAALSLLANGDVHEVEVGFYQQK